LLRWLRRLDHDEEGVSLVETLIALMILAFVMMAMASTTVTSLAAVRSNERQTYADQMGNDVIEHIQGLSYENVAFYACDFAACSPPANTVVRAGTRPAGSPAPLPGAQNRSVQSATSVLTYTTTTELLWADDPADGTSALGTDSSPRDYKSINVTVSWPDGAGEPSTMRFDARRTPPMDGVDGTVLFEFDKYFLTPEPVCLDASGYPTAAVMPLHVPPAAPPPCPNSAPAAIPISVTMSRQASSVTVSYTPRTGVNIVTPLSTIDGGVIWTGTIASTTSFTAGYKTLTYTATSPTGETAPPATDSVWFSPRAEEFVTITNLTSNRTTIGKNNANDKISCSVTIDVYIGGVTATNPITGGSLTWVSGSDNGVLSSSYVSTDANGVQRYQATIASGTRMAGSSVTITAMVETAEDEDEVSLTVPLVGSGSCT
jgi:Tfp pilus assembly protein PilV